MYQTTLDDTVGIRLKIIRLPLLNFISGPEENVSHQVTTEHSTGTSHFKPSLQLDRAVRISNRSPPPTTTVLLEIMVYNPHLTTQFISSRNVWTTYELAELFMISSYAGMRTQRQDVNQYFWKMKHKFMRCIIDYYPVVLRNKLKKKLIIIWTLVDIRNNDGTHSKFDMSVDYLMSLPKPATI
ncbi:hypothetical protein BDQ17DRAFT_1327974 [Cyathus striatus]|nr:hypothetical protein BDQ17DRAFT_1327974 [Cyathus striatus]